MTIKIITAQYIQVFFYIPTDFNEIFPSSIRTTNDQNNLEYFLIVSKISQAYWFSSCNCVDSSYFFMSLSHTYIRVYKDIRLDKIHREDFEILILFKAKQEKLKLDLIFEVLFIKEILNFCFLSLSNLELFWQCKLMFFF